MNSDTSAGGQWQRVAAELRACREAQQRAWGDVDNTTLGRYLAGEVEGVERQQVEHALEELPELRKLTDLVRDVLRDFEPVASPPSPVLLPFPSAPWKTEKKARPAASPFPRQSPTRFLGRSREQRATFWAAARQRSALVVAACLLLAFGLLVPRPEVLRSPAEDEPGNDLAFVPGPGTASTRDEALSTVGEGKLELVRADADLTKAHVLSEKNLGPDHAVTQRALRNRAAVYQLALNATSELVAPPGVGSYVATSAILPAEPTMDKVAPPAPGPSFAVAQHPDYRDLGPRGEPRRTTQAGGRKSRTAHAEAVPTSALVLGDQIRQMPSGEAREKIVPVLARALANARTTQERAGLVRALGELGPAARDAVPTLTTCLNNASSAPERYLARSALAKIGPAGPRRYGIEDEGACLSVRGLRESTHAINLLARAYNLEVFVETVPSSAKDAKAFALKALCARDGSEKETGKPEGAGASHLGARRGARAIHVVLSKHGEVVRVEVCNALRRQGLNEPELVRAIRAAAKGKNCDPALKECVTRLIRFEKARRARK